MNLLRINTALLFTTACFAAFGAATATAQTATTQTLDRVEVFNKTVVLEMAFSDPRPRPVDFVNLGITGTRFTACQLTGTAGLFCLDNGRLIRNWPNTELPGTNTTLFSCADTKLGLDSRKADTCTGMTVDLAGSIWIAGKKASTHSLIKVMKTGSCPAGYSSLNEWPGYCYREYAAGRPLLVDINPIDGDTATVFELKTSTGTVKGCVGVLGLEERKTAVFFPEVAPQPAGCPTSPRVIATGKDWGLQGNEQLLSAALLQVPVTSTLVKNYAVATTTTGRVLAVDTAAAVAAAVPVFAISSKRGTATQCDFTSDEQFGLRSSSKSGRVYLADRKYCQVLALKPVLNGSNQLTALVSVSDGTTTSDLTLRTGAFPPDEPTLAPGISIDLKDCASNCALVTTDGGANAATLAGVQLASTDSGLTLFQVKNIPDCRWMPLADRPPACAGAIVAPGGTANAYEQYLNVTPLLPKEVTDQFLTNPLPPMYVSPKYRSQVTDGRYTFDAFFGVTQEVSFSRTSSAWNSTCAS